VYLDLYQLAQRIVNYPETARHVAAAAGRRIGLAIIDDDEFRTIMDAAMSGHLPETRTQ
jgi:predicted signal transduction protein with EAL and GGDEF domain